jgi:hypothetical protein
MKKRNILRNITYLLMFGAIFMGTNSFNNGNYSKGLKEVMKYGVIPLGLSATLRHIFFSGDIIKGQRFFEFEAGGTNLAFSVAAIVALFKDMNNDAMGLIFLMYSIYLFMGSLAWYLFHPKGNNVLMFLKFWSIAGAFAYFSYIAFAK